MTGAYKMNEESARSSSNSMTSQVRCYHGNCPVKATWGISSGVKQKNPDGSPLTVYVCEDHYNHLTYALREAGTRYSIFPLTGDHPAVAATAAAGQKEHPKYSLRDRALIIRIVVGGLTVIVAALITPFLVLYFGGRWLLGYDLPFNDQQ